MVAPFPKPATRQSRLDGLPGGRDKAFGYYFKFAESKYAFYIGHYTREVIHLLTAPGADKHREPEHNDNDAAAVTRVHYRRVPAALPPFGDLSLMAA